MKKLLSALLCATLLLFSPIFLITASAASYPIIYMDTFESSQTIVEGDTGVLKFNIFIEYKNERYNVEVYDSNNRLVASASQSYYNSSGFWKEVTITVDTDALDFGVGRYKIVYWMDFYTFGSWHSAPNKNTSYFSVIKDVCRGNHNLKLTRTVTEATCEEEGTGYYTCSNCDYAEYKAIPKAHNLGEWSVVSSATCTSAGKKQATCQTCGATETETIPQKAHNYGAWEVVKKTTCTEDGSSQRKCIYCNHVESKTNKAVGHHTYTNACDTTCNVCNFERPITHTYSNDCDKTCNVCGYERAVGSHIYTNACDTTCNECGEKREISHTYTNTCDTTCNECGEKREISHTYTNTCDTTCNICNFERTITHTYSNDCDKTCNVCGYERAVGSHIYTNACDTTCNECGEKRQITHTYDNACDATCNVCNEIRTVGPHEYDDKYDEICNKCGAVRDVPMRPLGIVGIVTGGTILGGASAFLIVWFVVKKKKWADLLAIFKK